jgi:hypothetical protein
MRRSGAIAFAVLALAGLARAVPPYARTEPRTPCAQHDPWRLPFVGELHVHTGYSLDALNAGVTVRPRDAYRYARGEPLALVPGVPGATSRTVRLARPLDFTAVTDHAEFFGGVCGTYFDPSDCSTPALWRDTRDAAEEFYDRTDACAFTTFVGYEYSAVVFPDRWVLHRNVIFRNAIVPDAPISFVDEPTPQGLWRALAARCRTGLPGCDALAIPHNPNLSNGLMFEPVDAAGQAIGAPEAALRAATEPLVEIIQTKGESECRPGVLTNDERCGFEKVHRTQALKPADPGQPFAPLAFVRNVLKQGLAEEDRIGVNPFRLGFVGGTDNHNGAAGGTPEEDYIGLGTFGVGSDTLVEQVNPALTTGIESNPGGLTVLWAEENSRDALFAAMRRREAYATSGTRPIVRLFAGDLPRRLCRRGAFVATGYARGVPMGGELGAVRGRRSPRFAVLALRDPGTAERPGTPLERIQIVKGWVDAGGQMHEQVHDVAVSDHIGPPPTSCASPPPSTGADQLCTVWQDPDFDRGQRAFYYARVLEAPACRWSAQLCDQVGVDCSGPVPSAWQGCCDPLYPRTIQERAWTSPVWYQPDGITRVRGRLQHGRRGGDDVLRLAIQLGRLPRSYDPATTDLIVRLRDDDEIARLVLPAGALHERRPGRFVLARGSAPGLGAASLRLARDATATLTLRTERTDLAAADRGDHFVEILCEAGSWSASHVRWWRSHGRRLGPAAG